MILGFSNAQQETKPKIIYMSKSLILIIFYFTSNSEYWKVNRIQMLICQVRGCKKKINKKDTNPIKVFERIKPQ